MGCMIEQDKVCIMNHSVSHHPYSSIASLLSLRQITITLTRRTWYTMTVAAQSAVLSVTIMLSTLRPPLVPKTSRDDIVLPLHHLLLQPELLVGQDHLAAPPEVHQQAVYHHLYQ